LLKREVERWRCRRRIGRRIWERIREIVVEGEGVADDQLECRSRRRPRQKESLNSRRLALSAPQTTGSRSFNRSIVDAGGAEDFTAGKHNVILNDPPKSPASFLVGNSDLAIADERGRFTTATDTPIQREICRPGMRHNGRLAGCQGEAEWTSNQSRAGTNSNAATAIQHGQ